MRIAMVLLHRWFGLAVAVFLFVAGFTGAVISWDHELDAWLNPQLYHAESANAESIGAPRSSLQLAARVEQIDPRVQVTYLPLGVEPGDALQMSVEPRVDPATGTLYDVDYNQVAVDPATGEIQGKRYWGAVSLSRENLLPFLYKLHYSMHIPDVSGIEMGVLFMGIIGVVWVIDCFVALYLSFPNIAAWRKSFAFRWQQGGYKLNFDLHRSGGVWIWLLLLMVAITSVSMNLNTQVMRPIVSWFSTLSASPFAIRQPVDVAKAPTPGVSRAHILQLAQQQAPAKGWQAPAGALFYSPTYQAYGVGFFAVGNEHGDGDLLRPALGNPWLYFDAQDGRLLFAEVPGTGSAGDVFLQAQFPLHSGRIIGITGRVLMSLMGLMVAILSVTGVVIWVRKRRARLANRKTSTRLGVDAVVDDELLAVRAK